MLLKCSMVVLPRGNKTIQAVACLCEARPVSLFSLFKCGQIGDLLGGNTCDLYSYGWAMKVRYIPIIITRSSGLS